MPWTSQMTREEARARASERWPSESNSFGRAQSGLESEEANLNPHSRNARNQRCHKLQGTLPTRLVLACLSAHGNAHGRKSINKVANPLGAASR